MHAPHWPVSQPTCVPVSAELVAQELDEQRARIDVRGDGLPLTVSESLTDIESSFGWNAAKRRMHS